MTRNGGGRTPLERTNEREDGVNLHPSESCHTRLQGSSGTCDVLHRIVGTMPQVFQCRLHRTRKLTAFPQECSHGDSLFAGQHTAIPAFRRRCTALGDLLRVDGELS